YAHREDSPWHEAAAARMTELAEERTPWAIPWPCLHEFVAIVTHPGAYVPPTPLASAIDPDRGVAPGARAGPGAHRGDAPETGRPQCDHAREGGAQLKRS